MMIIVIGDLDDKFPSLIHRSGRVFDWGANAPTHRFCTSAHLTDCCQQYVVHPDFPGTFSGVNLDEEAADLVRFQQAYQATAQVIATASSLFR